MRRSDPTADWRTIIVPVKLTGAEYRLAHESFHKAALIWNGLVEYVQAYWKTTKGTPSTSELRAVYAGFDPSILEVHSQSKQAIVDDLLDAIATYRENKKAGRKARAPRHEKNYRPLVFTARNGWSVKNNKLLLSFGRGKPRITLPLPVIADQTTGEIIPPEHWGAATLCWDRDARCFTFNIAVKQYSKKPVLNPDKLLVSDEGIINSHTTAVQLPNGDFEVTVIVGRHARSIKHRRNKAHSELTSMMARCVKGSRRWKKLDRAKKRASATANAQLKDFNHKVSRVVANEALKHDTGRIAYGDVRGIEKNSRAKKRANKDQRRRLSQWERGTQEKYIGQKTGATGEHVNEAYSSKTCPACLTRNRPNGRNYRCKQCNFVCHRDAVGSINIYQKVVYGAYTRLIPGTHIRVIYRRPVKLFQPQPRRNASNQATGGSATRVTVSAILDSVVTTPGAAVAVAA